MKDTIGVTTTGYTEGTDVGYVWTQPPRYQVTHCPFCDGSGVDDTPTPCAACDGTGHIVSEQPTPSTQITFSASAYTNNSKPYRITLQGCDDSTVLVVELTAEQYELLTELERLSVETSTYGCMPVMEVTEVTSNDE